MTDLKTWPPAQVLEHAEYKLSLLPHKDSLSCDFYRGVIASIAGWISVDEKMPEDGDAVLVHQDGGIIFCAEAEHGWFYPDEFPNLPKQGREITHWMPLPAAPTSQEPK